MALSFFLPLVLGRSDRCPCLSSTSLLISLSRSGPSPLLRLQSLRENCRKTVRERERYRRGGFKSEAPLRRLSVPLSLAFSSSPFPTSLEEQGEEKKEDPESEHVPTVDAVTSIRLNFCRSQAKLFKTEGEKKKEDVLCPSF